MNPDSFFSLCRINRHISVIADWKIQLGNLVILRIVRIKIVFPVKFAESMDFTVHGKSAFNAYSTTFLFRTGREPAFRCTPDRYGYWALRRMRSDSRRKSLSLWKVQYALPDQSRSHTVFSSSDFPPFCSRICLRKYASLFFKSGCRTDNLLLLQAVSNQLDSDRKARL